MEEGVPVRFSLNFIKFRGHFQEGLHGFSVKLYVNIMLPKLGEHLKYPTFL